MISEKITHIRRLRKKSERELSTEIGMSMTGFRQALAKDDFKLSTLLKLSKALNVDICTLVKQNDPIKEYKKLDFSENEHTYGKCDECKKRDSIIEEKNGFIADLKYTIESLKHSLIEKDKIIELYK